MLRGGNTAGVDWRSDPSSVILTHAIYNVDQSSTFFGLLISAIIADFALFVAYAVISALLVHLRRKYRDEELLQVCSAYAVN